MRSGRIGNYLVFSWMSQLNSLPHYLTLFSSDPYLAQDPTTVEAQGAQYARDLSTTSLSGRLVTVTSAASWHGMPAGTVITHLGAFDAAFNGNLLWAGPMQGAPYTLSVAGSFSIQPNTVHVGLDA